MTELAKVEVEQVGGVAVARIIGEVDASNAQPVQRRLLDGVSNEGAGLVVDLTACEYLDSAAIRALFDAGDRLQVRGMELRLVATPDSFVADVLATVRFGERHLVDDGLAGAVSALADNLPRRTTAD